MEKQMPFSEKMRALLREKGVYLVLFVCVAVVGVAMAAAFWPRSNAGEEGLPEAGVTPEAGSVSNPNDESLDEASRLTLPAETGDTTPIPDFTAKPQSSTNSSTKKLSAPVSGKVIWDYAMDELIYSVTLNQWMTHSGVDIAVAKDSEVHAVLGGTVEAVYTDDALGTVVVLSHSENRKTLYANLKTDPPVTEGAKISAGDCIGYVGNTATAECSLQSHLHFEIYVNGSVVNPADYVLFES